MMESAHCKNLIFSNAADVAFKNSSEEKQLLVAVKIQSAFPVAFKNSSEEKQLLVAVKIQGAFSATWRNSQQDMAVFPLCVANLEVCGIIGIPF